MEVRKRLKAMAEVDPPRDHRYPTRWKLRCHVSHSTLSSHPQDKDIATRLPPSKRNKQIKCTLYLPTEIIFNILLLVPAKVLHQVVRYVCKQWNDIINDPCFIKAHCQSSSAGRLIQNPRKLHHIYYIEGDKSTKIAFPFPATIIGSINGLVLFHDLTNLQILSVINPVTKVKISLRPLRGLNAYSSIGFAITSGGHYKVVVRVPDEDHCPKRHVMVFTLGIDKDWRFIDLQGCSEMECIPVFAPRFIAAGLLCWCSFNYPCFAMDVDTETFYHLSKPDNFFQRVNRSKFISLGVGLGIIQGPIEEGNKWRLWKLTDIKAGKWTELSGINVIEILSTVGKELFPRDCRFYHPAMLIDDIFWFYYVVDGKYAVFRFNLANQRFVFFPVNHVMHSTQLLHHVHTLLSPEKCYILD